MTALLLASLTGYGVHLLYTARILGWSGVGPAPKSSEPKRKRRSSADWMTQAGLGSVAPGEFILAVSSMFLLGAQPFPQSPQESLEHRFHLRRIGSVAGIGSQSLKTHGHE